jgi:uncharacterized DUF497 family protein
MNIDVLKGVIGFDWNEANIEHSIVEKRFLIIGKTERGRLLYQIFTR